MKYLKLVPILFCLIIILQCCSSTAGLKLPDEGIYEYIGHEIPKPVEHIYDRNHNDEWLFLKYVGTRSDLESLLDSLNLNSIQGKFSGIYQKGNIAWFNWRDSLEIQRFKLVSYCRERHRGKVSHAVLVDHPTQFDSIALYLRIDYYALSRSVNLDTMAFYQKAVIVDSCGSYWRITPPI